MQLPQLILDPKRKCGLCTACCTVLGVPELTKAAHAPCEHQCGDGCAIYDDRLPTCKGFYCAWRLNYFTDDDRPDKTGVVFWFQLGSKFSKRPLLIVDELRVGALSETRPHALIMQESLRQLVFIRAGNTRKLVGPPAELDRVQPIIDEEMRKHGLTPRDNPDDPGINPIN